MGGRIGRLSEGFGVPARFGITHSHNFFEKFCHTTYGSICRDVAAYLVFLPFCDTFCDIESGSRSRACHFWWHEGKPSRHYNGLRR